MPSSSVKSRPSSAAKARRSGIVPLRTSKFWRQAPSPKQYAFLSLPQREALYGGAAGGGKTQALLMGALQYADVPGYAALLLRRTYSQLAQEGQLLPMSREWLIGTGAGWNDKESKWIFPSGATITFGYLDSERDLERYSGPSFQYIGFDELTQFTEAHYRFLFSRLRRTEDVPVPLRMRGATNPGGKGHDWVKRRFLTEGRKKGRIFIPAHLSDNPGLVVDEYVASLNELDPVTRERLLRGDWEITDLGGVFDRSWFGFVERLPKPQTMRYVRYWDLASTEGSAGDPDYTVGLKLGVGLDGRFLIADVRRDRLSPNGIDKLITQTAKEDGPGVPIFMEQERGAAGKNLVFHYKRRLVGYSLTGDPPSGSKLVRAGPVASIAEAGDIDLLRASWNGDFLDEAEAFDGSERTHDDQVDSLSGAFNRLVGSPLMASEQNGNGSSNGHDGSITSDLDAMKW